MAVDAYTAQITNSTLTSVTGQYFDLEKPFAFPRYGNSCIAYTSGREYFKAVADAIRSAQSFIMITDWQLDYDVELDQRGQPGHPGRLSELLADAIQRGVHIRIILYDSIKAAVDTHDESSQDKLSKLPEGKGSISVLLENQNTGRKTFSADSGWMFSHHQKSIVVDGRIGFLGGLDLAYGRWDTNAFDVVINPALRIINDAYNQQLLPARQLTESELALLADQNGRPGFLAPASKNGKVFDEHYQPRQPWQDVAIQIAGPAAYDVFVNFVLRWNSFAGGGTNIFDNRMAVDWFKQARGAEYLVDPLAVGAGTAIVQICRSASSAQLKDELVLWDDRHQYVNDDWKRADPERRKIVQAARAAWAGTHQTSILDAMTNCIRTAQAFIYIENQFFMSDCGVDQYGAAAPSKNQIIRELANAIGRAIYAERPFHVWLTLPEHPEGLIEDPGTSSQAWWALQGVKRGRDSLIHRVNSTLVSKNAKAWGLQTLPKTRKQTEELLASKGMAEEWRKYLTVLNLRNYGHTDKYVLTEMIYVHSKLMIVDDAVAIIGSANINDRSLLGNGDTELAAVVVDTSSAVLTEVGGGVKIVTRKFARDLRVAIWEKHLGVRIDELTTGSQKNKTPQGIDLARPLEIGTINGIKELARANSVAYEKVFIHTPRNSFKALNDGRRLGYPVLSKKDDSRDFTKPPVLQSAYMQNGAHNVKKAIENLHATIRGFWVEMPLEWGSGQGVSPEAPVKLPEMIATNQDDNLEVV
jgi:phospholipase D1/2